MTKGMLNILLELWLDKIGSPQAMKQETGNRKETGGQGYREVFREAKRPIIAVCRTKIEHGTFEGSEHERVQRLEQAIEAGAKFVDIGIHTNPSLIKKLQKICCKKRATLIISKHFWNSTPSLRDLMKTYQRAKKLGAHKERQPIVKIATHIKYWSDNIILFEFTRRMKATGKNVIVVGMGERGKISRIGCPLLGSYLTYAALDRRSRTAEGQMTFREMRLLSC